MKSARRMTRMSAVGIFLFSAGVVFANVRSSDEVNVNMDEFLQEIDRANHPTRAQLEERELAGIPVARNSDLPVNMPLAPTAVVPAHPEPAVSAPVVEDPPVLEQPEEKEKDPSSDEDDE